MDLVSKSLVRYSFVRDQRQCRLTGTVQKARPVCVWIVCVCRTVFRPESVCKHDQSWPPTVVPHIYDGPLHTHRVCVWADDVP